MLAFSTCWNNSRHTDGETMIEEIVDLGFTHIELSHGMTIAKLPGIRKAYRARAFHLLRRAQLFPLAGRGDDRRAGRLRIHLAPPLRPPAGDGHDAAHAGHRRGVQGALPGAPHGLGADESEKMDPARSPTMVAEGGQHDAGLHQGEDRLREKARENRPAVFPPGHRGARPPSPSARRKSA